MLRKNKKGKREIPESKLSTQYTPVKAINYLTDHIYHSPKDLKKAQQTSNLLFLCSSSKHVSDRISDNEIVKRSDDDFTEPTEDETESAELMFRMDDF